MERLKQDGKDVELLKEKICAMLVKTIIGIQPSLAHIYSSCHSEDETDGMCFELFGVDVLLDHKLQPWLIEVNHSPSFATDSALDKKVKFEVIRDALRLVGISSKNRKRFSASQKGILERNSSLRSSSEVKQSRMQEREQLKAELAVQRTKWEEKRLGGYTRIYPTPDSATKYQHLFGAANEIWANSTGVLRSRPLFDSLHRKQQNNNSPPTDKTNTEQTPSGQTPQTCTRERESVQERGSSASAPSQSINRNGLQTSRNRGTAIPLRSRSTVVRTLGCLKDKPSPCVSFISQQQQQQQQQQQERQQLANPEVESASAYVASTPPVTEAPPMSLSSFCTDELINKQTDCSEAQAYAHCKTEAAPSQASTEEPETAETTKSASFPLSSSYCSSTALPSLCKLGSSTSNSSSNSSSSSSEATHLLLNLSSNGQKEVPSCVRQGGGHRLAKSEVYRQSEQYRQSEAYRRSGVYRQPEVYRDRGGSRGLPMNLSRVDVSFTLDSDQNPKQHQKQKTPSACTTQQPSMRKTASFCSTKRNKMPIKTKSNKCKQTVLK
ncbi:hypothetical protein, conserved [Eimeria acervulina]|uniref:Tubulin-tyrosine ligase family protein n=1 Tax=Eimeria acervulina TaxID=5801 RepID=U6G7G5_EIMAC|nr:hypothetical protein, conserved [Eimeria acervulina]CDI76105.1 hypothetical protein, conserved [Eimeria acervulina]